MTLTTRDNSNLSLTAEQQNLHLDNLRWMAASTLNELCGDNHLPLLVFPQSFDAYGDNIGAQRIFDVHGYTLETGNIMGFVGRGNTQVRIQSRFAYDDGRDYFLHYMLQRVFSINLFDLKHQTNKESIFDFLLYLFPTFLKRAIRQGLYREYQMRQYNDTNIRGRIDINYHIRQNIPFSGKVAYNTREYTKNNHITQLIRHTIEYIINHPMAKGLLFYDQETKSAVSMIREATPTYNKNDRQRIINANIRPICHPYFCEYKSLQRLCLQILRHEGLKYGQNENEIYGILFDGAWLWEEYLDTFLHPILRHPQNRIGEGREFLFTNHVGECYPDFYNEKIVLDAKYKGYVDWNIQRTDLYQVISYMYIMKRKKGGFIVPTNGNLMHRELNGYGGTMAVLGMTINHQCQRYSAFCDLMKQEEHQLYNAIKSL